MAFNAFIPQLWSARLLATLDKTLVYAGLCNRDYEGEIKDKGSSVKINSIGPITVNDYTKDTDMSALEVLSTNDTTLTIDQSKSFGFYLDDVNKAQAAGDVMDKAMKQAAYALADVADKYIAGLYTEVGGGNALGSDGQPITPTKSTIYDSLVDMNTRLTECNVPKEGRWVVVAPWVTGMLLKDDRLIKPGATDTDAMRVNGYIGRIAGLNVYESNNVPNTDGSKYKLIAGHSSAICYAEQISQIEAFRPEKRFGDAVKGLHVYGAKVVLPKALVVLTANPK